ncbi:hypothetical protein ABE237_00795 [Brevibacillus formosus]|uniref:DUF7210 family protein n=1 Tax=Brevibacillus formosus TaxID=54913 RepID=UPI0018CDA394|nr:hypothetical protein [Brevibacillus formosus]
MSNEQVQDEKQMRKKSQKATLLKNIKYNGKRYKIGDEIDVESMDRDAFIKSGIIEE